jgi:hypothetical protein
MVQCPECGRRNPDWARLCQGCGALIEGVARPPGRGAPASTLEGPPKWVRVCYAIAACYLMLSGSFTILVNTVWVMQPEGGLTAFSIAAVIFGAAYALVGLGLLFHVEAARGVANFVAGLLILFGVIGLIASLLGAGLAGAAAVPFMIHNVLDIAIGGFLIYLIGETETRMPNV